VNPAIIISIPIIKRAIPTNTPTNFAPKTGDTIIVIETARAITPTPMLKALAHPLLSLFPTPCTILSIATKNNANASKYMTKTVVPVGNAIRNMDTKIAIMPNTILAKRDFLLMNIPLMTSAIPITNKAIERIYTIDTVARAGLAMTYIDSMTAITPKPICAPRTQPGLLSISCKVLLSLISIHSI
jgi:hypothetical protein